MAEDADLMLQLEGRKKKKKKKPVLDLTTGEIKPAGSSEVAPPSSQDAPPTGSVGAGGSVEEGTGAPVAGPSSNVDDLQLELSKKKKKKKPILLPEESESVAPVAKAAVPVPQQLIEDAPKAAVLPTVIAWGDFDLPKKKKKRRENITFEGFDEIVALVIEEEDREEMDNEDTEPVDSSPWAGSDRDYTYEELLERVFNIMRQKNPKMFGGQIKKLVMKPPQVVRVGAKKTSFVNFTEICKQVHRQPKHLLAFLLAELGTSGSVDGNHQLIIKGRFQQKQIETVLRRYIKEYVKCHTCRSPNTLLQKETRLFFLQCETCGSRCSVQNIKSGFQAVMTGQRREQRARQQ